VSVRKSEDFDVAGHIPNAVNIPWVTLVQEENLARLDPGKSLVFYCYYGHATTLCCTITGLLGYDTQSLSFGMMGWNGEALVKPPWDGEADYEVETGSDLVKETFASPTLQSDLSDAKTIVLERARGYLSGEGPPVITSVTVKEILDDWGQKKVEYQIVDVRTKGDYGKGHVPHAIPIPWRSVAHRESLKLLDPGKTAIVCSDNGQTGQVAATVLNLLGYPAMAMKFGMMDWNTSCVDISRQWAGSAGFPVETASSPQESR
jgi:rhodanese-related sulfurtransferase